MPFLIRPPPDRAEKVRTTDQSDPDAVDAEKRNMRRNEVYHEIKSKEEM